MAYIAPGEPSVGESTKKSWGDLVNAALTWLSSGLAVGDIKYTATALSPMWLLCDGASLLRSEYPVLFAVIGTDYGSVDSTHFTLPEAVAASIVTTGPVIMCIFAGE